MLARTEADRLARMREEQGSAEREEMQVRGQTGGSRRFGMLLLGSQINPASTRLVAGD